MKKYFSSFLQDSVVEPGSPIL